MENKKNLRIRISLLYVVYIAALIGGIIYNTGSEFERGALVGHEVTRNIVENLDDSIRRSSMVLIDIRTSKDADLVTFERDDDRNTEVAIKASHFDIIVSQDVESDTSLFDVVFGAIGGSSVLYVGSLAIMAVYIAIFVLLFLIIHSLQRSLRNDLALDNRCTWYTRIIGLLIIVNEFIDAFGQWHMAKEAAKVLEGTEFTVNTAFPLNYWTIVLAVLVIFTAEVFSIGSKLGEEQKLTI